MGRSADGDSREQGDERRIASGSSVSMMGSNKSRSPSGAIGLDLRAYQTARARYGGVLENWREHPSKADLWLALLRAASKHGKSAPTPVDFIGVVLGCTMPADRLNDHAKRVVDQFEKLKRE